MVAALACLAGGVKAADRPGDAGLRPTAAYRQAVSLGRGGEHIVAFANRRLDRTDTKVRRVLLVLHGAGRNADDYFRSAMAAAYLAGALEDTLVVAPRFSGGAGDCRDQGLDPGELTWTCDSWKFGEPSLSDREIDSFQVVDRLIGETLDPRRFPNVASLVVLGHSAGAQFVSRYATANRIDEGLRVKPTYVAANASSYAYLDEYRPVRPEDVTRQTSQLTPAAGDRPQPALVRVDNPRGCGDFNRWPYGMNDRKGYAATVELDRLKRNLAARNLVLLGGQLDNVPLSGFDTSCPAIYQGDTRLDRAISFDRYAREHLGGRSRLMIVPLCGHNERCMFTSPVVAPILFPEMPREPGAVRAKPTS